MSRLRLPCRATLTSLPKEIVEKIVDNLIGNDKVRQPLDPPHQCDSFTLGMTASGMHVSMQVNLALCCKGMLPMLCMGTVRVKLDKPDSERPLTQLSRCLAKQPNSVLHLKLFTNAVLRGTDEVIDLRCAGTLKTVWMVPGVA